MAIVSRSTVIITAETDRVIDLILQALADERDEAERTYVSISEISREAER